MASIAHWQNTKTSCQTKLMTSTVVFITVPKTSVASSEVAIGNIIPGRPLEK